MWKIWISHVFVNNSIGGLELLESGEVISSDTEVVKNLQNIFKTFTLVKNLNTQSERTYLSKTTQSNPILASIGKFSNRPSIVSIGEHMNQPITNSLLNFLKKLKSLVLKRRDIMKWVVVLWFGEDYPLKHFIIMME